MRRLACLVVTGGVFLWSAAAVAQLSETQNRELFNALGEKLAADAEARCLSTPWQPEQRTAPARAAAQRTLQAYLDTVRSGRTVGVSAHFSSKGARWIGPDGNVGNIGAIADPYARAADPLLPPPARFVLANDRKTALGLWTLAAGDTPLGAYAASFRREGSSWRLVQLALVTADAPLPRRYCHVPGDIDRWLGSPVQPADYWVGSQPR
ncbi:hypothetical protein [Sandarakinorhabdus rubra]|uniref:hypothetical protein n=1 Tax=Sandarakinorhabdus rubra TaxID=2672568 RepID=UPI0013DC040E|nr:hypothetical protein [Sandarakinorhabdus rubra]